MGYWVVSFPILQYHKLEFIVYLQTVEVAWSFKTKRKKGTKRWWKMSQCCLVLFMAH